MKIGKETQLTIDDVTVSTTVINDAGFTVSNLFDNNTLKKWQVSEGDCTISFEFTATTFNLIGLFNLNIETNVTIKTWASLGVGSPEDTETFTAADLVGFTQKHAFLETASTNSITAIELVFTGSTPTFKTSAGFLWAGDVIDFGCSEALQPFDTSSDDVTLSRANTPDTNRRYEIQGYKVTTKKDVLFDTLRTNFRTLWQLGYTEKRPFILKEDILPQTEILLGMFAAPRVGYDTFQSNSEAIAQATIEIREVF